MKKRILFLAYNMGGGGAEKVLVNLINALDPKRYDISLVTYTISNARNIEVKTPVKFINLTEASNLFCGKKVSKHQRIYSSDFIKSFCNNLINKIVNFNGYDIKFAILDSYYTTKFVPHESDCTVTIIRIAGDYTQTGINIWKTIESPVHLKMQTDGYAKMTHIVAGSNGAADGFAQATGVSSNVTIINNIFNIDELKNASMISIDEMKEHFVIGTVGRFHPTKGHMRLLEACHKLHCAGFLFELWLLGTGPDELELRKKVDEYGMQNVRFLGYQENPYKYMRYFDLYVNPAFSEGFPNAVCEAVILGIPCVVADHAGEKEIFGDNNEYGMVVENSEEGIYRGIEQMLSDESLYRHYKEAVLKRADFFDQEKVLAQYEALFNS